ncbi:MAG: Ig-like domain-containing protein, partial [Mycobacterium sp.]
SYTAPSSGTVRVAANGVFTYTPKQDFTGVDSFTYTIKDVRGAISTATVTIAVTASDNVAPYAGNDTVFTPSDTAVSIHVLDNDSDGNSDALTVKTSTQPLSGTVVAQADGTFVYTPKAGFQGVDTFTYEITDPSGASATGTVVITVGRYFNDPLPGRDYYDAVQDTNLVVDAHWGVLANDFDPDGDPLTAALAGLPAHGTVVMGTDGSFVYAPEAGFVGTDGFTYVVTDSTKGSATTTVSVTVTAAVNLPPVADFDGYQTPRDTPITFDPLENDTDPEGQMLTAWVVDQPEYGTVTVEDGKFTYTPATGFVGFVTFGYRVSDGVNEADGTVAVTVVAINQAPVAVDDAGAFDYLEQVIVPVLDNDTDPDGDDIYVSDYGNPAHGTTSGYPGGAIEYTPDDGFVGTDEFAYTVTDAAGNTSTATVTVTILGPNHAPTANDDKAQTTVGTPVVIDVLANDADPDGDRLTVEIDTAPDHGTVTVRSDGSLLYTPPPGFVGTDYLNYTVTDPSGRTDYASVAITVTAGDDGGGWEEPDPKWYTAVQGKTLTVPVGQGVLADDPDFKGWKAGVDTKPAHGTLRLNADGSFTYTPAKGFVGQDTFKYYAYTSRQGDGPFIVNIDVTPSGDQTAEPTTEIVVDVASGGGGGALPACTNSWFPQENAPGEVWSSCWSTEAPRPEDLL